MLVSRQPTITSLDNDYDLTFGDFCFVCEDPTDGTLYCSPECRNKDATARSGYPTSSPDFSPGLSDIPLLPPSDTSNVSTPISSQNPSPFLRPIPDVNKMDFSILSERRPLHPIQQVFIPPDPMADFKFRRRSLGKPTTSVPAPLYYRRAASDHSPALQATRLSLKGVETPKSAPLQLTTHLPSDEGVPPLDLPPSVAQNAPVSPTFHHHLSLVGRKRSGTSSTSGSRKVSNPLLANSLGVVIDSVPSKRHSLGLEKRSKISPPGPSTTADPLGSPALAPKLSKPSRMLFSRGNQLPSPRTSPEVVSIGLPKPTSPLVYPIQLVDATIHSTSTSDVSIPVVSPPTAGRGRSSHRQIIETSERSLSRSRSSRSSSSRRSHSRSRPILVGLTAIDPEPRGRTGDSRHRRGEYNEDVAHGGEDSEERGRGRSRLRESQSRPRFK